MTDDTAATPSPEEQRANAARAILARRLECRNDPVEFAIELGYKPAEHHRLILDAVRDMLVDDAFDVLILLMPPGSAKSTYGSIVAAAWALLRNPAMQILLACNVAELAQRFGRQIRGHVAGEAWQRLSGTSTSLADDSAAAGRWDTPEGGGLYAVGVGGTVLGRRSDLTILDDLVASFEVAANPAQLQKIQEWIKSDVFSRSKPHGKYLAIQQRMAYNDPPGFLSRYFDGTSTRVRVISLPMEATDADDPLGRAPGQILWPEWFTAKHIETAKLDDARWKTMYQQQPLQDTGEFFSADWIDTRLPAPHPDRMAVSLCVDLATGAPGGDFTVIAAIGKFQHQGNTHIYVLDVFRRRVGVLDAVHAIQSLAMKWNAHEFLIDDDSLWKASKQLIFDKMSGSRFVQPNAISMGGKDKPTRASPLRAMMQSGRVHFMPGAPWLPALENEFTSFPLAVGNGVDDIVDAIGLLPRKLVRAIGRQVDEALPSFIAGVAGSSEEHILDGDFGELYRKPGPPPESPRDHGHTTVSMLDRRPDESEQEFWQRKANEDTSKWQRQHGHLVTETGRHMVINTAFEPARRPSNSDRIGD